MDNLVREKKQPSVPDLPRGLSIALSIEAALAVAFAFAGQITFLALDRSDHGNGYDHPTYNSLLWAYNRIYPFGDGPWYFNNADPKTLLFRLAARLTALFGWQDGVVFALPMLGMGLAVYFGYKVGKRLGESPLAGWLAAAALALSPFMFGLARRFTPWSLVLGVFLAIVHFALAFKENPTYPRLAALFAAVIIGGRLPHETTSKVLFDFFVIASLGWIFIRALPTYLPSKKRNLLFLFGLVLLIVVSSSAVNFLHQASYVAQEAERFETLRGQTATVPGYFIDMGANTLGPSGAAAFLLFLALWPFLHEKKEDLFWFALPLAVLAVLTIIPKKNTWYVLEVLTLGAVLAGVSLRQLARRTGPIGAVLLVTGFLAALGAQYYERTFTAWKPNPAQAQAAVRIMNSVDPVAFPVSGAEGTYRTKIDFFAREFDGLFGKGRTVNLGLILNEPAYELVPYYLRKSGLPLKLYEAVQPDAPELGHGLDAVLMVTHGLDEFLESILRNESNFSQIFVEDALRYTPLAAQAREGAWRGVILRRLDEWNRAEHRLLGDGMMLILPRKHENPNPPEG